MGKSGPDAKENLEKGERGNLHHYPIQLCEHGGFQSQCGCRGHVNNKHSWFFYFDEKLFASKQFATGSFEMSTKLSGSSTDGDVSSPRLKESASLVF